MSRLRVIISAALALMVIIITGRASQASVNGVSWHVTSASDSATDGDLATHTGSLRFILTNATSGDVVVFGNFTGETLYVGSTLVVPDGVTVGHTRAEACGSYLTPLVDVEALTSSVDPVFDLGAGATLRNVDVGGGNISVRVSGPNVDVCAVGLGIEVGGDGNVLTMPPTHAALIVDGDHATLHRSYVNGPIVVTTNGSDSQLGDAVNGSGEIDAGIRDAAVSVLSGNPVSAQRVTIRDPFPRVLVGLVGSGISGGDDVLTHTNNWVQKPTLVSALTNDNFATVNVRGTANPLSVVDIYFDNQITLTRQTPVIADATGIFSFTGALPGNNIWVTAVSTLNDPAYADRVGSSSEFGDQLHVVKPTYINKLGLVPAGLNFTYLISNSLPAAQGLIVAAPTFSPTLTWNASVTTTDGLNWLSVSPLSNQGDGTITVTVSPGGLVTGTYHGSVAVTGIDNPTDQAAVSITFDVQAPPSPPQRIFLPVVLQ